MLFSLRKICAVFVSIASLACLFCTASVYAKQVNEATVDKDRVSDELTGSSDENSYFHYFELHKNDTRPQVKVIEGSISGKGTNSCHKEISGQDAYLLTHESNYISWKINVQVSGMYSICPFYYPLEGTGKDIEVSVSIDKKIPFSEASCLSLSRTWQDSIEEKDESFSKDLSGNDIRPQQVEKPYWREQCFANELGMYSEPYLFYLEEGEHSVCIAYGNEPVAFKELSIKNTPDPVSYEQYISKYKDKKNYAQTAKKLEAEKTFEKTTNAIFAGNDHSSAAVEPCDPVFTRLNVLGGSSWNQSGEAVSWKVNVESDGLYKLAFHCKQNYSDGMRAYRCLYVNGKIPFKEASNIPFEYHSNWYTKVLGDQKPLLLYLKKGDIITLECTSGKMDYPLREIQQTVLDLNSIYRDIIMITGSSPSIYEDYKLDVMIPNLATNLKSIGNRLDKVVSFINDELGKSCSVAASIKKSSAFIEELSQDVYYVPERLSGLKSSIESLASLLLSLGGQGLCLDSIYFVPQNQSIPNSNTSFWKSFEYKWSRFFYSFTSDYSGMSTLTSSGKKTVNVWVGMGRDQTQILSRQIEEDFMIKTGVGVKLNLVAGDATLIKATLAGKGPDVALTVGYMTPVNLAARGALVDLNKFNLQELKEEIFPSAWTLFDYQGGTYGIPESQACDMLFYRKDILNGMGVEIPQTWDDFYKVLQVIQSKNLQVAWPEINTADQGNSSAINVFNKFYFQQGGEYYNKKCSATMFNTEKAYDAFQKTVDLYRLYGLTRDVSVFNRFRSGEAPIAIAPYTLYTQLVSSAPEIRGLWSFAPIPGTLKANKSIDRTDSAFANGCIMMKAAEKHHVESEAFSFLSWWAGEKVQTEFGKGMESIMGIIGRTAPANRKALCNLGWPSHELSCIVSQLDKSKNPPQVVGNYQVNRSFTSALRDALCDNNTPRRSLQLYNKDINDEIARKRKEFHMK